MKPLHILKEKKQDLYKNLLLVVLLSTGVSLCVNYICSSFLSNTMILWCGIGCVLLVVIAYIVSFYKSKSFTIKADCLFVVDKNGELVNIDRYRLASDTGYILDSVFGENKAFKQLWTAAFTQRRIVTEHGEVYINASVIENKKIIEFVGELIEYLFLQWLSVQQMDYFSTFDEKEITALTRERVADYLLQNRILEMISKPYQERQKFYEGTNISPTDDTDIQHLSIFYKGTVYNRFDLKLPKHSTLKKANGALIIKNRNYTIKFKHGFKGTNANLPRRFKEMYLKQNDGNVSGFGFYPELEIKLNPLFFLVWKNWKYMKWIDILGENFHRDFSFKEFLNNIGYETALTSRLLADNQPDNTIFEEIS